MKEDTSVKYFHSGMPGAPVLSGTAGATIAVLDACLVTGWGLKTVETLVVAGNVATANISTGHSASERQVILIAGASPAALNGEWRVTSTTVNTVQFVTEGISDQTATGTITLKIAPTGWAKPFSSTNLAVYQSTDPAASNMLLRVNDTDTTTCQVVGYESMSSVDVGSAPFPTVAQKTTGLWWQKSNAADATARPWFIVADTRAMYYGKAYVSSMPTVFDIGVFGDIASVKSVDPYACALFGRGDSGVSTPTSSDQLSAASVALAPLYIARSYSGVGAAVQCSKNYPRPVFYASETAVYSGSSSAIPYPNPADGGLYVSPLLMAEGSTQTTVAALRGSLPGFYCIPQQIPQGAFAQGDKVIGVSQLPGRTLLAVQSYYTTPPANQTSFIDITGPWR